VKLAVAVAALALAPTAGAYVGAFHTPARAVYCEADKTGASVLLSCSVAGQGVRQWRMRPQGSAQVRRVYANIATQTPVLAYGRTWRKAGFACTAQRTGLTCRNGSGHGWSLSRERQRIF
jgi:hypothetical protein